MANNYQFGGWYNNPSQGNKNMRYWGNDYWTTGEDPTGGRGVNWQQTAPQQSNQQNTQSNTSSSNNINDYFEQQNKLQQSAIQPAIQSLQSSIPNIQKNVETQVSQKQADITNLNDRYKNLIDTIKNQGQTSVNKQTVVTAGELGKRGIEGSSTLAGQEIASATLPIEQQTQSLAKETGLSQEADIRTIQDAIANLQNKGVMDVDAVNQSIANLQSGAGQNAISQALAQAQAAQTSQAAADTLNYQKQQDAIANALAQTSSANTTNLTNAQIQQIYNSISNSNKTSTNVADVLKSLGINVGSSTSGSQQLPQAKSFVVG